MSIRLRAAAAAALFKHYRLAFGHAWARRHETPVGLFREDEAQFLAPALAIQEMPPSRTARWVAGLLVALLACGLAWSVFGHMDIVVNAQGKVIPAGRVKELAAVETGSVVRVAVQEGQHVQAGQVLLELDTTVHDAEYDKARGDRDEAVLAMARNEAMLRALDGGGAPALQALPALNLAHGSSIAVEDWQAAQRHVRLEHQAIAAKQRRLADDAAHSAQALSLAEQQAASHQALLATRDVSVLAWQEKEQARLQWHARLAEARHQLGTLAADARKQAADQLNEAQRRAAALAQDARRAGSSARLMTLRAPVDGTVQQLKVHAPGTAVQAAAPLLQVVPVGGPVEVEAFIENKDKGFVHPGQPAAVKVETFQYTKYGTVPAHVTQVSDDAIADERRGLLYAVKVTLEQATLDVDGRPAPVTAGMAVGVEIKTGRRRIIDYVLDPLLRHTHEAAHER